MPRCNLTLKQKCQIIELSNDLSTDQIAKKFHVHPTTITRTLQKKSKILEYASRVNVNFKTVQTNRRGEEHDAMILRLIKSRQENNLPISIKEICDKAVELAKELDREIKSKRGWWRRFKVRCNIIKCRMLTKSSNCLLDSTVHRDKSNKRKVEKRSPTKTKQKAYTFRIRETKDHVSVVATHNGSNS